MQTLSLDRPNGPNSSIDLADALARAAEEYRPKLLAAAERILRDASEAEDAVQDGLVAALRSLDRFRGDAKMSSWLYRITINCALMRLRSRRRRPVQSLEELGWEPGDLADPYPDAPDERAATKESLAALGERLAELPDAQRRALWLRAVDDLGIAEVARKIGRSENAAKMLVHRAREQLRGGATPARAA